MHLGICQPVVVRGQLGKYLFSRFTMRGLGSMQAWDQDWWLGYLRVPFFVLLNKLSLKHHARLTTQVSDIMGSSSSALPLLDATSESIILGLLRMVYQASVML